MINNKFTILIPTRERSDTLYHTIRTCLNQTYGNLSVLVSDNFGQDTTRDVVNSFNDSRLKYVNTGKRLSMSGNFDYALSHTSDGYVMFLGDDDAIVPNSLEYVNNIINETGCEAVVSHNAFYTWPNHYQMPNKLFWSLYCGYEVRNTKKWLKKYFTFKKPYTFDLPGAYCGFVKRRVFENVTKNNQFFRSVTPDAYSALAIAFTLKEYVYSYTPFAIHGASSHSNGAANMSRKNNQVGEEFKSFLKENTIPFHKDVIMTKAFRIGSAEAFLQFADAFPELTKGYSIDWKLLLSYVLTEASENTMDEITEAVKKMCIMHSVKYDELLHFVPNRYADLTVGEIIPKIINKIKAIGKSRRESIDNTLIYGVSNVYDAALLLKFLILKDTF